MTDWTVPVRTLDPRSLLIAPLVARGIRHETLAWFGVEVASREGALWWRVPIHARNRAIITHVLVPVDGMSGSRWEGPRRPDLLYNPLAVAPRHPLLVVAGLQTVWLLHDVAIPAVSFLCGPHAVVPALAVGQVRQGWPACCVVIDDTTPRLPGGAAGVARALRAAGLEAGAAALPPWIGAMADGLAGLGAAPRWAAGTPADLATVVGHNHAAVMEAICMMDVLGGERISATVETTWRMKVA